MTAEPREHDPSLSFAQLRLIDQACDKFETAWMEAAGSDRNPPSIQDFLQAVEPWLRKSLLQQLMRLDIDYRSRRGTPRCFAEYMAEFGEFASVIHELFGDIQTTDADAALQRTRVEADVPCHEESSANSGVQINQAIGRFRVLRELGRGSFGAVYLALDEELQREVAIKVAHRSTRSLAKDDRELAEARMAASLDHPAIAPVLECGRRDDGSLYVVSKLIDGIDLKTRIKEFQPSVREAVTLVATVAEAAHYAHGKGLVHRDIKPANILIDNQQRPYLSDFGLALKTELVGTGGEYVGTPSYMSPEQARMEGHLVDRRSDIFSLAVVLHQLIYGRMPFVGDTREALLEAIERAKPPDFNSDRPQITPELKRILGKALSRRATDRHQTAQAFAEDLRAWLRDATPQVVASTDEWRPVVPRGLRSFTAEDAPFFTRLVPGPRNREGMPDAIAFWKTRIESHKLDEAFRVGVLYGHSGTGKSSLVKAGVIPHLDPAVVTVWITATPNHTEQAWLQALRRQFPSIRPDEELSSAIRQLRDARLPSDQKLLIIVDQFEQWLSANQDFDSAPLVAALRQCDGVRAQVLLLVRDDYWSELTQCLAAAAAVVDSNNSRATELFDAAHARRVLQEFGASLRRFDAQDPENRKFVEQAVAQMTDHAALVPVRLALFADVMKTLPWTVAELNRMGGVEGATTMLLDQIVSGDAAHPTLRHYSRETGYLLRALLPVAGSSIKASPKTVAELREASGLDASALASVLEVLDREYRLVATAGDAEDDGLRYQLSHDYLVPIVRQWSQRTHGDTLAGRMELLLDERTKAWIADRRARNLPSLFEWIGIEVMTPNARRTNASRRLMRTATRYYVAAAVACAMLLTVTAVVAQIRLRHMQWANLVEQLSVAETPQVEALIAQLARFPQLTDDAIARFRANSTAPSANEWALELALFVAGNGDASAVLQHASDADPQRLRIICGMVLDHADRASEAAREPARRIANAGSRDLAANSVDNIAPHAPAKFLAAATVLAQLTPEDAHWPQWSRPIVAAVSVMPNHQLSAWIDLFRPVSRQLQQPVLAAVANYRQSPDQAALAAKMVEAYYAGERELLISAIECARPEEFRRFVPMLARYAGIEQILQSRLDELDQPAPAVEISVKHSDSLESLIEATQGFSTPDYALTLSASRGDFVQFDQLLQKEGYGLRRCRPTNSEGSAFCGLWWRHQGATKAAWNLTRGQLLRMDQSLGLPWRPIDVASYRAAGDEAIRYCAFWGQDSPTGSSRINDERIRVFDWQLPFEYTAAGDTSSRCLTNLHAQRFANGRIVYAVIDRRSPARFEQDRWTARTNLDVHAIDDVVDDVSFVKDLCFSDEPGYQGAVRSLESQLAATSNSNEDLSAASLSATLAYRQAQAQYCLGHVNEAYKLLLAEMTPGRTPQRWVLSLMARTAARLNKADAMELLPSYLLEESELDDRVHVESLVRECTGGDGIAVIREALRRHPDDDMLVSESVAACAEAAEYWRGTKETRREAWIQLLIELLTLSNARDIHEWSLEDYPSLVREVEDHAALRALVPEQRFHAIHHNAVDFEQVLTRGRPREVMKYAEVLAEKGFQPHAIASLGGDEGMEFLILWLRPLPNTETRVQLSNRKARLTAAMLALREPERVANQLTMSSSPTVPFDVARLAYERRIPEHVWWSLAARDSADVRFFALVALRNYPLKLDATELATLAAWYREDPDAGVHSAVRAILDSNGKAALRIDLDRQLGAPRGNTGAGWFVNSVGMTFAIVTGPVTYKMGSPSRELLRWSQDEVLHRCRIERTFAISATETTCEQFGQYRHDVQASQPDYPQNANWFDAVRYCRWLSEKEGIPAAEMCFPPLDKIGPGMIIEEGYLSRTGYRLPTEAEWEFACRAGSEAAWYFGEDFVAVPTALPAFAVFSSQNSRSEPVARRLPNRLGLFDMSGNLGEWCQDRHQIYDFTLGKRPRRDAGACGRVDQADRRVYRGGHYSSPVKHTRSASRGEDTVSTPSSYYGFRLVRTLRFGDS